jgi:hypothetical protein
MRALNIGGTHYSGEDVSESVIFVKVRLRWLEMNVESKIVFRS